MIPFWVPVDLWFQNCLNGVVFGVQVLALKIMNDFEKRTIIDVFIFHFHEISLVESRY